MGVHRLHYPVIVTVMITMYSYTVDTGPDNELTRSCYTQPCQVNGGWSEYRLTGHMSVCPRTCGIAYTTDTLERSCTNPAPAYGGMPCSGRRRKMRNTKCKIPSCPVNGGWSEYRLTGSPMSVCPLTCGIAYTTDTLERFCTNPAPDFGGLPCSGRRTRVRNTVCNIPLCPVETSLTKSCNTPRCPVNGSWGNYRRLAIPMRCSVTCGKGTLFSLLFRECTNPRPAYNGKRCPGENFKISYINCNRGRCNLQ